MKSIIIDSSIAGISGDMFLSSLIDMGGNKEKVIELSKYLQENFEEINTFTIKIEKVLRKGISSTFLNIQIDEKHSDRSSRELLEFLNRTLNDMEISKEGKKVANEILDKILNAEAVVHKKNKNEIHLHETGSFDTIFDIVGAVLLCEDLDLLKNTVWFGLPLAVGGGTINFSHGTVSVPAPATIEILKNVKYKIFGGPIDVELATPTGVAILTTLIKKQVDFLPKIIINKIGYGAGFNNFSEIPNVLKLLMGGIEDLNENWEEISVIETNIDDVSGEIIGNLITEMISSGKIKDINVISTITKKNRPGYIIKVISDIINEKENINYLMHETGSLGVRLNRIKRKILDREIISKKIIINNKEFEISLKIGRDESGIINIKPEIDDVIIIAKKLNIPVHLILKRINKYIEDNDFI